MERSDVERLIAERGVRTVKVGTPDMDGVYRGKRVSAEQFLSGLERGFAQCDVILGWDIAEEPITGMSLALGSAETGFGDVVLVPDLATFRIVPWEDQTASVVCDLRTEHGDPVEQSPRTVLRRAVARAQALSLEPAMSAEFEFRVFREDQESLRAKAYTDLRPLNPGLNCYSMSHASIDDPVIGDVRAQMVAWGVEVEGYNREHGEGMYEMNLRYAGALESADRAMLFKSGSKEVLARHGCVPTFMAKFSDEIDGCSGHIHQSLWRDGANAFHDAAAQHAMSATMRSYLGGLLATLPELTALYAPNVNSYRRFVSGSWAPTTAAWGIENRTAALRVIGGDAGAIRIENRLPGADLNAYLGFAACLAGGISGIERKLEPPEPATGDVYARTGGAPIPRTLDEAVTQLARSDVARDVLGDAFIEHYVAMRTWEVAKHRRAVTDWQRRRYFEQV